MKNLLTSLLFVTIVNAGMANPIQKDTLKFYYGINESDLNVANKAKVMSFFTDHKKDSVISVRITGYTDFLGGDAWNRALSVRRAETVKSFILEQEHKMTIIECSGKGKLPPLLVGNPTGVPQNRRVEVVIQWKEPPVVPSGANSLDNIDQVKEGEKIILRNLNFEGGRHILLPGSVAELDKLVEILMRHPSMVIAIQGYVCCTDSLHDGSDFDTGDDRLSVNRAKAIYDLLIERGIKPSRLSYEGFGGKRPLIHPERTEYDREQNRRVEIRILKK